MSADLSEYGDAVLAWSARDRLAAAALDARIGRDWRTLCDLVYRGGFHSPGANPPRARTRELLASLTTATGVPEAKLAGLANAAGDLRGANRGPDSDPDRFAPPDWAAVRRRSLTALVIEVAGGGWYTGDIDDRWEIGGDPEGER